MARNVLSTLALYVVLPSGEQTDAAVLVNGFRPGFAAKVVAWQFITDTPAAGEGATRTFNLEIGSTDVSGTATAIALADASAVGQVKMLGAPTVPAEFTKDDSISIEVAAGGTAFTAGAGTFYLLLEQSARGL